MSGTAECVKSTLLSKNVTVCGKRTSIRLEPEMWQSLHDIAMRERCSIHDICSIVKLRKQRLSSLTAAISCFCNVVF